MFVQWGSDGDGGANTSLGSWGTQGGCKGLDATPRFALYVVRIKPLAPALLLGGR
jgi:hypothetical protein